MNRIERERRRIIPKTVVCWLNGKSTEIYEDIFNRIKQLRHHCIPSIHIFDDLDICIDFLTDIDENRTVYLVIAESIDEQVLSFLNTLEQIKSIYMFPSNEDTADKISSQIEKDMRQHENDFIAFQTFTRSTDSNKVVSNDLIMYHLCIHN